MTDPSVRTPFRETARAVRCGVRYVNTADNRTLRQGMQQTVKIKTKNVILVFNKHVKFTRRFTF